MSKRQCAFIFLSHLSSAMIIKEFKNISYATEHIGKSFFLYDATGRNIPDEIIKLSPYLYSNACLNYLGYPVIGQTIIPGHAHFPVFQFYLEHADYGYYWIIEHDVRFSGNWQYFFDSFSNTDADFLTCHIRSYEDEPRFRRYCIITA